MDKFIEGKHIHLRDVELSDAEFILSLRLNPKLNQFISKVEDDLSKQKAWIQKYKTEGKEYYFIIESSEGIPYGTVRIYDIREDSFCWGSWIVKEDAPHYIALESALLLYEFGFGKLHFARSHFDVRKQNEKVVNFHTRCGAAIVREDALNYYFEITKEKFDSIKQKYVKYLK